jgi:putative oxidoreductase
MRFLERYTDVIYALFRLMFGLLFASHGAQKLFGMFGGIDGKGGPLPSSAGLPYIAGWIELATGLLIAIGLFAGFAAFLASGTMAVAYFMVHAPRAFWPVVNEGEAAVLYCFAFLYIAARGSGRWSVDGMRTTPAIRR